MAEWGQAHALDIRLPARTLSYDGKGSGTYTVLDGSKKLFSKTFKKSGTKLLRTGNALEFRTRSAAGTPSGS